MASGEVAPKAEMPRNSSLEDLRQLSLTEGDLPEADAADRRQSDPRPPPVDPQPPTVGPSACGFPYPVPYPFCPPGFGFGMMPPTGFPCWTTGPLAGQQKAQARCQQQPSQVQAFPGPIMGHQGAHNGSSEDRRKSQAGEDFVASCLLDKPVDEVMAGAGSAEGRLEPRGGTVPQGTGQGSQRGDSEGSEENRACSEGTEKKVPVVAEGDQPCVLPDTEPGRAGGRGDSNKEVWAREGEEACLRSVKPGTKVCEQSGNCGGVSAVGCAPSMAEKGSCLASGVAPEGGACCAPSGIDGTSAMGQPVDRSTTDMEVDGEKVAVTGEQENQNRDSGQGNDSHIDAAVGKPDVNLLQRSPADGICASSLSAVTVPGRPEANNSLAGGLASDPATPSGCGQEVMGPSGSSKGTAPGQPKPGVPTAQGAFPALQRSHTSPASLLTTLAAPGQHMQSQACPLPAGLRQAVLPIPGAGSGVPAPMPFPGLFPGQSMPPWYAPFGPGMHIPGAVPGTCGFYPNPFAGQMPQVGAGVAQGFPVSMAPVPLGMGHQQLAGMHGSEGMRNMMLGLVPVTSAMEVPSAGPSSQGLLGGDGDKANKVKKIRPPGSCASLGVLGAKGQKRPRKTKKTKTQALEAGKHALELVSGADGGGAGKMAMDGSIRAHGSQTALPAATPRKGESEVKTGSSAVEDMQNNDNLSIAQRRPKRVPGGDPLQNESVSRLCDLIRNNFTEFESQGRILRLKQYLKTDARPSVINLVLEALKENTLVEALYIQNFELGMYDEQLELLTDVLKQRRIWALYVGENFHTSLAAWEAFADELPRTDVAYLYVSEHHLEHTNLKTKMRDAIRANRKRAPPRDAEVIRNIKNMWFNPKVLGASRADWRLPDTLSVQQDLPWNTGSEASGPEDVSDFLLDGEDMAGVQGRPMAKLALPKQGTKVKRRGPKLRSKRPHNRKAALQKRQGHRKLGAVGLQPVSAAGRLPMGSYAMNATAALGPNRLGHCADSECAGRAVRAKRGAARKESWSRVVANGMRLRSSGRKRVWRVKRAPSSTSLVAGPSAKRCCLRNARMYAVHAAEAPEDRVVLEHTSHPKNEAGGRATFADVVNARLINPGRYKWTVGQDQCVEVNIQDDGAILYKGTDYCSISSFALS
ncbi:unnamed protein product, partial [Ostreobium quekettii]